MKTSEILKARKGKQVRDYKSTDATKAISKILISCYISLGQRKSSEDLVLSCEQIYQQVMYRFKWITIEEIELACSEAIFGDGEKPVICPRSIICFIRDYIKSEDYQKARKEDVQIAKVALPPKDEKRGYLEWISAEFKYLVKYRKWPREKRFATPRAVGFYPILVEKGWIKEDFWKKYIKQAEEQMKKIDMYDGIEADLTELPMLEVYAKKIAVDEVMIWMANQYRSKVSGDLPE